MILARLCFLSLLMRLSCDTVPKALLTLSYVTGTTFTLTTDFAILSQVGITPICHKALAAHPHLLDSLCTIANCSMIYFRCFPRLGSVLTALYVPRVSPIPFMMMDAAFGGIQSSETPRFPYCEETGAGETGW